MGKILISRESIESNIPGHGEHKIKSRVGRPLAENEEEKVVAQKDILGDVLVSVTGECYRCRP